MWQLARACSAFAGYTDIYLHADGAHKGRNEIEKIKRDFEIRTVTIRNKAVE